MTAFCPREQLEEFRRALSELTARFRPGMASSLEAETVAVLAGRIEAVAAALRVVASARAADGDAWRRAGYRSPAEWLGHLIGISTAAGRDSIEVGRRLQSQPVVAAAAVRGELSAAQVSLVSAGVDANPDAEAELLETARNASLSELRDHLGRVKAAACEDPEARRRAIRARRQLSAFTDSEGVWHLRAQGNPEDGAQIMAALAPIANEHFHTARCQGRREPPAAYAFDALVTLALEATSQPRRDPDQATPGDDRGEDRLDLDDSQAPADEKAGPPSDDPSGRKPAQAPEGRPPNGRPPRSRLRRGAPAKILVRVDYSALLRGIAIEGETCELVGYGPVPVSVINELLATADPFIAAILTKGQALVGAAHLGRYPRAHEQSALEWIYPTCAVQGCPAVARLQRDHRIDWAHTHTTSFELLDLLCAHHHALKTRHNWALTPGLGKRPFVPPDHPQHPNHQKHHDHPPQPTQRDQTPVTDNTAAA